MPPRQKKIGRPAGSKNKRGTKITSVLKQIKSEPNLIKTENDSNGDVDDNDINSEMELTQSEDINDSDSQHLKQDSLQYNELVADKKVLYNCPKCPNKNFKFKKNFKEHLLLEHSTLPGSLPCKICHVVCPDKDTLNGHILKAHNRSVFKCKHCDKKFVRQAHVLRHMAQKGCDGGRVASFPCEICDAKFTRKDNLIVHLRQMHISRSGYRCKHTNCIFTSKNFNKLIRHWHAVHANVPNQFECDSCGKSTMSRAAMAKHLEIHGEKKYSCDVCSYSTYTIEVMRRHILTHVEDKPYKCTICGSSYIQRAQLDRHMTKHCESICDTCGQRFNSKARLVVHKRQHEGFNKLKCPYKGCVYYTREFLDEDSLVVHVNKHIQLTQFGKWKCEVCQKRFTTELNMRRHLSTHTLDRPRRCMYCVSARAYVRGQQLVRHVRKFHPQVFQEHLSHVRNVLSTQPQGTRVTGSEMESILNLLDAESERILEGYSGFGVLYGGMQSELPAPEPEIEDENSPLMSEEMLSENISKLLEHLIDEDTLQCFGWPEEPVDNILEKVIEQCGAKAADRGMWSRVQRLRENAKHLFLYVVDDKNVAMMLGTHTIDQIIKHILAQVVPPEVNQQQSVIEIELEVS